MSPEYVRPYVKAHKNDDRDAEAIAEAATPYARDRVKYRC
jgi:transposase